MNPSLGKLHMALNAAVCDFRGFPWPNRLGKRDEKVLGVWLNALRDKLQRLDNDLYAEAQKDPPANKITLYDAARVLSQNLERVAISCGPCTYAPTAVIYCQQDGGILIQGELTGAAFAPREAP